MGFFWSTFSNSKSQASPPPPGEKEPTWILNEEEESVFTSTPPSSWFEPPRPSVVPKSANASIPSESLSTTSSAPVKTSSSSSSTSSKSIPTNSSLPSSNSHPSSPSSSTFSTSLLNDVDSMNSIPPSFSDEPNKESSTLWTHPSDDMIYKSSKVYHSSNLPKISTLSQDACLTFEAAYKECVRTNSFLDRYSKCFNHLKLFSQCVCDYEYTIRRMGYAQVQLSDARRKYMIHETDRILRESWKQKPHTQEYAKDIHNPLAAKE